MNRVVPGLIGSAGRAAAQSNAEGAAKQEGGGVLFDGIDGIPATDKAVRQYKREALEASPQVVCKRVAKSALSSKRKQAAAKAVQYNF
jgi:hypothetical protein